MRRMRAHGFDPALLVSGYDIFRLIGGSWLGFTQRLMRSSACGAERVSFRSNASLMTRPRLSSSATLCCCPPGLITDDMKLLSAKNPGWKEVRLSQFNVVKRLDAVADNEANLAALAQISGYAVPRKNKGAIRPSDSFLYYISTNIGIGGAVVRHGQVDRGDSEFAGELGLVSVALDGPQCPCGRCGCLEMYAGQKALVEASGVVGPGESTQMDAADEVLKRYREHEDRAVSAVDRALRALASTINILDIDTVILGGLWDRFGKVPVQRLNHELEMQMQMLSYPAVQPRVVLSDVNVRPALLGAAQIGLRRFIDNPLQYIKSEN
jgi:predicted NBD/HSP70 family sugar kinase